MKIKLKPVREQVIVITGATSGIGLATAKQAAKRGASVVLNARAEEDLQIVAKEMNEIGGQVAYAAGDVADIEVVRNLAQTAIREFGRIDTWVNNAGVSMADGSTSVTETGAFSFSSSMRSVSVKPLSACLLAL